MDRSEWMAEVCRHAALTMEAHGLGNRTEQLRNVADQLAAAPPPPAEQSSGDAVEAIRSLQMSRDIDLTDEQFQATEAAIAALSQRPVVSDAGQVLALLVAGKYVGQVSVDRAREIIRRANAPQQPTTEEPHD